MGSHAAARLTATAMAAVRNPTAAWRALLAIPLVMLLGCTCWRIGEQVTGGLGPGFTVNAWGGPTYLGAMFCHYLDGVAFIAASGWLLDKVLLSQPAGR